MAVTKKMSTTVLYIAAASHDWYSGDIIEIGHGWNRTDALTNLFSKFKIDARVDRVSVENMDFIFNFLQTHNRWNSGCIDGKNVVGDGFDREGLHIVIRKIPLAIGFSGSAFRVNGEKQSNAPPGAGDCVPHVTIAETDQAEPTPGKILSLYGADREALYKREILGEFADEAKNATPAPAEQNNN